MLDSILVPIHRDGVRFVVMFGVATGVLWLFSQTLGLIGAALTLWCIYFFRNPDRVPPARPGVVVAPADGVIVAIGPAPPPEELDMGAAPRTRISIFLNLFDVHVNRVPAEGVIAAAHYRPGRFLNASLDKASDDNERQSVRMTTSAGHDIAFVQIAGLIARRIVCQLIAGQQVEIGARFGIIRFGSRLDVYLDQGLEVLVLKGQRAVGGETVLAQPTAGAMAGEP